MAQSELLTRNIPINTLMAEPPGLQNLRSIITAKTQTFVPIEPNPDLDALGEILDRIIYAHGKPKELIDLPGPNIIVTGSSTDLAQIDHWPGINRNIHAIPLQDVTNCLDLSGLAQEFGLEIKPEDLETAT